MTVETPTTGEVYRRLLTLEQKQEDGFNKLNLRLDNFPTEPTLLALLQVRDTQIDTQNTSMQNLLEALAKEREERIEEDNNIKRNAESAKRWAVTTLIGGAGTLVAFLSFILVLAGNSTA